MSHHPTTHPHITDMWHPRRIPSPTMFHLSRAPNGAISAISPPTLCIGHPKPHLFSHPNRPKFNPRKTLNPNLTIANAESRPSQTALSNPTSQSPPFPSDEIVSVEEDRVPLEGVIQIERLNSSSRFESWARVALLAGGDVLVLLLFAAIGRYNHGFPVLDLETLHTADPFIAGWFLAAYFLGGYGDDGKGINGSNKAIIATAKSWAVGIPLGLIIRVAMSGHIPSSSFVLVSMGSTAVLLIGWRVLLTSLLPNDQRKKNDVYRRGSPFELFELLTSLVRRW